nr:glucose-6-phosphate dehydrogenase [Armatimonadota bacterium]
PVQMLFDYAKEFRRAIPEAYERLILDAILGEAALFARADEVEAAWGQITPILREWESLPDPPEPYFAGTWGPRGADELLRADGRHWHNPGPKSIVGS